MAIRKKIGIDAQENMDKIREQVISRGGHVLSDIEVDKKKKEWMGFCLRIKVDMLNQIDQVLEDRAGMSKTGWILEAIQEKLKRSTKSDDENG